MTSHCLFQESWWLDAVAPGQWRAAVVEKGGEVVARMPYVYKRKYGIPIITTPKLTPVLGPWLKPSGVKYAKRLAQEKDLLQNLLEQLPRHYYCSIPCDPSVTNLLPFYWAGFDLRVCYTYRLTDLSNKGALGSNLRENIRSDIRKAEKRVAVRSDLPLEQFYEVNRKAFSRQGKSVPYSLAFLQRLDDVTGERGQRRIFFAVDDQERIHAVCYIIWDSECAYYLMGGRAPELHNSGASSLLMWHAIQHAATVSQIFDFEGSMIEPIERFFRAFGAAQTPYYVAIKMHPALKVAMTVKNGLKGTPANRFV